MSDEQQVEVKKEETAINFVEFLEGTPPSSVTDIIDLTDKEHTGYAYRWPLLTPDIQLHCSNETCNGTRFFRCRDEDNIEVPEKDFRFCYVSYVCSNCQTNSKTFSLAVQRNQNLQSGRAYKFGELPLYGPPTPARLVKLIGPDRDLFLKGRRCENQGLGIGAFVYYRRVVENQKNRILGEIIKVSKKLNADPDSIAKLETAKNETQFSTAISSVKESIPQTLLVNGHNPLTLLHTALSDGLHDRDDGHCLELAISIRVVLGELSERLAQALKDEAELNHALTKLLSVKKKG